MTSLVGEHCDDCGKPFGRDGAWHQGFEHRCDDCALTITTDPVVRSFMEDFIRDRAEKRKQEVTSDAR